MKTAVLKVNSKNISLAAEILRNGGLVAFPTETVYGLAANLSDGRAMARLCRVKARPKDKPFTVHISDPKVIRKMGCSITKEARALMNRFWPGPLTVILKARDGGKIGFRMPDNRTALDLISEAGFPIAAPSANISGGRPPTTAKDVLKELDGKIDLVLDAGPAAIGVESTVIDMTVRPFRIIREGAISLKSISKAAGNG